MYVLCNNRKDESKEGKIKKNNKAHRQKENKRWKVTQRKRQREKENENKNNRFKKERQKCKRKR